MKKIYYIVNTVSERETTISGVFKSKKAAKKALKYCCDWHNRPGTGTIYQIKFGLNQSPKYVYHQE